MSDYTFWGLFAIPAALALLASIVWRVKLIDSSPKLLKIAAVGAITVSALTFLWSFVQWISQYE